MDRDLHAGPTQGPHPGEAQLGGACHPLSVSRARVKAGVEDRSTRQGEAAKDGGEHLVDLADPHQARHREEHHGHDDPADG